MNECEDCGAPVPSEAGEIYDWIENQREQIMNDDFVYGSWFQCATCGARQDPREIVVDEEGEWRNL